MTTTTYSPMVECTNCGFRTFVIVDKGVSVQTYLRTENPQCENCGCTAFLRNAS